MSVSEERNERYLLSHDDFKDCHTDFKEFNPLPKFYPRVRELTKKDTVSDQAIELL